MHTDTTPGLNINNLRQENIDPILVNIGLIYFSEAHREHTSGPKNDTTGNHIKMSCYTVDLVRN